MERARQLGYQSLHIDQIEFMEVSGFSLANVLDSQAQPLENNSPVIGTYDETLVHWLVHQIPKWGLIER